MRDEKGYEVTPGLQSEAQDSPQPQESPRSMQFLLPGMTGGGEDAWRHLLTALDGLALKAEILLFKSSTMGKTKHTPLAAILVVNMDGVDPPGLLRTLQAFHSILSRQMSPGRLRSASPQSTWACTESTESLGDVVRDAIENRRRACQAGSTPLDRVVRLRMGKNGAVERALVDLSKDSGRVQFRTVKDKKKGPRKATARSRTRSRIRW